jgi:transposase
VDQLESVTVDELQEALDEVDDKRPVQRLSAAIAYKDGVEQQRIADWFDVERKTIYNWITRFEDGVSIADATDTQRSGRNRKISEDQLTEFREMVQQPPAEAGFDAPAWTPRLVRKVLADRYDADYSIASCRRLLKEAGLSYQKPRPQPAEADDEDRDAFHDEIKKTAGGWMPR